MEITKADELQELTELGEIEFEKSVLNGPLFKNILTQMEEAALNGRSGFKKKFESDQIRAIKIIQSAFLDAGYECEIKIEKGSTFFNIPLMSNELVISWDKK